MSQSKRRKENDWKLRKQKQQNHGEIKSLEKLADEYDAQHQK